MHTLTSGNRSLTDHLIKITNDLFFLSSFLYSWEAPLLKPRGSIFKDWRQAFQEQICQSCLSWSIIWWDWQIWPVTMSWNNWMSMLGISWAVLKLWRNHRLWAPKWVTNVHMTEEDFSHHVCLIVHRLTCTDMTFSLKWMWMKKSRCLWSIWTILHSNNLSTHNLIICKMHFWIIITQYYPNYT